MRPTLIPRAPGGVPCDPPLLPIASVRELNYKPNLRKAGPRPLLLQTVAAGCGPLVRDATEDEQRSFDATARRLPRFLTDEQPE